MVDEGYRQIGALLRQAREERHQSVEDIARHMHIRSRYLYALEDGRISDMPGLPYAKGYLQAYAQHLGLDRYEIMRRFEQMEGLIERKGFFMPQVFSKEKQASSTSIIWGLMLALLAYGGWSLWLAPPSVNPSLVEMFDENQAEQIRITPALIAKTPCLRPSLALYPPCHVQQGAGQIFPLRRRYENVMQWAASPL
ncbi:MAG: helix-turn-helix domain-containing protein [Rickettsiales bacterium]|jgi:cytoskeleton protein RodZ|nr:helix-turn-helix domain-containing protein [Rickettsiales bacterium]